MMNKGFIDIVQYKSELWDSLDIMESKQSGLLEKTKGTLVRKKSFTKSEDISTSKDDKDLNEELVYKSAKSLRRIKTQSKSTKSNEDLKKVEMEEDEKVKEYTAYVKKGSLRAKLRGSVHTITAMNKLSSSERNMISRRNSKETSGKAFGKERRLSVASNLGAKDKLKNRKRDGTPEKSGTPSQDALADDLNTPSKNVIWNEEIEKLQIKKEDLQKLSVREPHPPEKDRKTPTTERFSVRKVKPAAELNKPKPKVVTVAKTAPLDAPVKPMDFAGFAGPRYDNDGHVVSHSILGNYDDFQQEAIRRGDLLDIPTTRKSDGPPTVPTLKYEKKKRRHEVDVWGRDNESNALRNWQIKMMERKRQQGYISKLLQKDPEDLAMNQADNYRAIQEDRYLIDRAIPGVDYGKGYRVGSEFWKQQEKFGDDLMGVHMTLTQTEKGYPPPVEHVGLPSKIREEKGWHWAPTHTRPMHYPWHKSEYLEQRTKQMKQYMDDLDPHKPDFDGLQVIGSSKPLKKDSVRSETSEPDDMEVERPAITALEMMDEDEEQDISGEQIAVTRGPGNPTPVFGPSIQFAGQAARWTGDSFSFKDQVGIEARVNFETFAGDRVTSYLTIVNNGTTSIYYDWKKKPKENPFNLPQATVQRFYFNNSSGVILPGETMKFPFVFKSPNAGVFQEQWEFESRPILCGGAALIVTLRGIAFQEDKFKAQRHQLESELKQKEAEHMVRHLLEDIVGGMRTPERPSSPIDAYITEEEIFKRNNPKLHYHHDAIVELKQLYIDLAPPEEQEGRVWDLSVDDLKDDILLLDDEDERKENFLHQLNAAVSKMSFVPQKPVHKQLYKAGYQLLVEAVDEMVTQSVVVRQVMGLPEKDFDEFMDDAKSKQGSRGPSRRPSRTPSKTPNPKLVSEDSNLTKAAESVKDLGEGRGGKKSAADKGKSATEKKPPAPAKEKDKGGKVSKESTKADLKTGKASATPAPSRGPPSRGKTSGTLGDKDRAGSPTTYPQSPTAHEDSLVDKKYKEKLFSQAYSILGDTIDKMEFVFDEITDSDPNRSTLHL